MVASFAQFEGAVQEVDSWPHDLGRISTAMNQSSGGPDCNYGQIINGWNLWQFIPETDWVDAIREIKVLASGSATSADNGGGLIEALSNLQSPGYENHASDTADSRH